MELYPVGCLLEMSERKTYREGIASVGGHKSTVLALLDILEALWVASG